jgi:DNA-binding transcriptional ArsR family regulator
MKPSKEHINRTAEILKGLGHPNRIRILRFLQAKKNGRSCVKDIQENMGLSQVETSRHLILMKNLSVLSCSKKGALSFYFISADPFIQNLTGSVCAWTQMNKQKNTAEKK